MFCDLAHWSSYHFLHTSKFPFFWKCFRLFTTHLCFNFFSPSKFMGSWECMAYTCYCLFMSCVVRISYLDLWCSVSAISYKRCMQAYNTEIDHWYCYILKKGLYSFCNFNPWSWSCCLWNLGHEWKMPNGKCLFFWWCTVKKTPKRCREFVWDNVDLQRIWCKKLNAIQVFFCILTISNLPTINPSLVGLTSNLVCCYIWHFIMLLKDATTPTPWEFSTLL